MENYMIMIKKEEHIYFGDGIIRYLDEKEGPVYDTNLYMSPISTKDIENKISYKTLKKVENGNIFFDQTKTLDEAFDFIFNELGEDKKRFKRIDRSKILDKVHGYDHVVLFES